MCVCAKFHIEASTKGCRQSVDAIHCEGGANLLIKSLSTGDAVCEGDIYDACGLSNALCEGGVEWRAEDEDGLDLGFLYKPPIELRRQLGLAGVLKALRIVVDLCLCEGLLHSLNLDDR